MKLNNTRQCKSVFFAVYFTICCISLSSLLNNSWADAGVSKASEVIKATTAITESDRRELLTSISKKAILPMFKELKLANDSLYKKTQQFCKVKTESAFLSLREEWKLTANAWRQVDSLAFGPTTDENIDFAVYFLPIKKGIVKQLLQRDALSKKDIDAAGVGAQGLGALEYILFSREKSTAQMFQSFIDEPQRCKYLQLTTELMSENIDSITREWERYGVQFGLAGVDSLYFLESSEAMTVLVNKIYQSSQKVSSKEIALFSDKSKIKKSTPYKLHAWRSGSSLEQSKAIISGIKRLLDDGGVLIWLNKNNKEQLSKELNQSMEAILQQDLKEKDLFSAVKRTPESLQSLVKNTQKLTQLIKVRLTSELGVELGFNDNDGD